MFVGKDVAQALEYRPEKLCMTMGTKKIRGA